MKTKEQLAEVLKLHRMWLNHEDGGKHANLIGADLSNANLSRANLSGADLRGANIIGADLSRANLSRAYIPMFCKWFTAIRDNKIIIGCKEKTPEEWNEWLNSDEEFSTKRGTPEFKQIAAVIRAYIAYFKVLND